MINIEPKTIEVTIKNCLISSCLRELIIEKRSIGELIERSIETELFFDGHLTPTGEWKCDEPDYVVANIRFAVYLSRKRGNDETEDCEVKK